MSHFVYILHSPKIGKFYIGETINPSERLIEHNSGKYDGSFTKQATDWELFLVIGCVNRKQALIIEGKIKAMKSTKYLRNLKLYPEIVERLLRQSN